MRRSYETGARSLAKALTYRFYQSFLVSPLIIYALTGDILLGFKFSLLEILVKIPAYYVFERIWSYIGRGYRK